MLWVSARPSLPCVDKSSQKACLNAHLDQCFRSIGHCPPFCQFGLSQVKVTASKFVVQTSAYSETLGSGNAIPALAEIAAAILWRHWRTAVRHGKCHFLILFDSCLTNDKMRMKHRAHQDRTCTFRAAQGGANQRHSCLGNFGWPSADLCSKASRAWLPGLSPSVTFFQAERECRDLSTTQTTLWTRPLPAS